MPTNTTYWTLLLPQGATGATGATGADSTVAGPSGPAGPTGSVGSVSYTNSGTSGSATLTGSDLAINFPLPGSGSGGGNATSFSNGIAYSIGRKTATSTSQTSCGLFGDANCLNTATGSGAGSVLLIPKTCHAYLTIYSTNSMTFSLNQPASAGATTAGTDLGHCSTSSSITSCTIDGNTVNAGTLANIFITSLSGTNQVFTTAFSCQ